MSEEIGYIMLHRKLLNWEWYNNIQVKTVFIHCLLKANFTEKSWQGMTIKRGQFVTSVGCIAREVGLSEKQVRICLEKLILTNELGKQTASRSTTLTVLNYELYQSKGQTKGEQRANEGQTKGEQRATTNKVNKENKENKEINIEFDSFWSAYDKKVGDKEKLKKKWQALTDAERENAMSYIPNYILSRPDKQFRKDPATFLNNKSWNDEIVKPANTDKKNYKLRNAQGFERLFELTPTELEEKLSAKFWYLCA